MTFWSMRSPTRRLGKWGNAFSCLCLLVSSASSQAEFEMQVAIITGGGAGMGFAVAQRLAQEGWFTVIVDVNEYQGQKTVEKLGNNAVFKKANVTIYSEQSSVFEETFIEYGRVDFVFANAGIAGKADFYDIVNYWPPEAPSMTVQDVNLTGVVYSAYLAMHYMRRNTKPGGVLVMTASGQYSTS